jgi:hypothetical protein
MTPHHRRQRWLPATLLGAVLLLTAAPPAGAKTWAAFVAELGSGQPPAAVLDYLKQSAIAQAAPAPHAVEVATQTHDGVVMRRYRLTGFAAGIASLEVVREEHPPGAPPTVHTGSMTTALGGLLVVAMHDQATGAREFVRHIEIDGELFPAVIGHTATLKIERVHLNPQNVVEETYTCTLGWTGHEEDLPVLQARCRGTTHISLPKGRIGMQTLETPVSTTASWVLHADLGWLVDAQSRVLEARPGGD